MDDRLREQQLDEQRLQAKLEDRVLDLSGRPELKDDEADEYYELQEALDNGQFQPKS